LGISESPCARNERVSKSGTIFRWRLEEVKDSMPEETHMTQAENRSLPDTLLRRQNEIDDKYLKGYFTI